MKNGLMATVRALIVQLEELPPDERISALNEVRIALHEISPLKSEPVDCVLWVPADKVYANDYNPNKVAPPEMELLRHSISHDGYTQPIVSWPVGGKYEVIDGFHRNRVGKECLDVSLRTSGHLPIVRIQGDNTERKDRIAATIRHNRARGKHQVEAMSDIVTELKRRNWKNERICRELGMDKDEVLRLCQISGLQEMFSDQEFSKSWDVEDSEHNDFKPLDDTDGIDIEEQYRHINVDDKDRIFHTYDKWECAKAGFYKNSFKGKKSEECERMYAEFLGDLKRFRGGLEGVTSKWKYSCEHYLTNKVMNRIAWLGQAAMCYSTGVPSTFRGGWNLLNDDQQNAANELALEYLNKWLKANGRESVSMCEAQNSGRQVEIY